MNAQEIIKQLQKEICDVDARMEYNRGYIHGLEIGLGYIKDMQKGAGNEHHNNEDPKH